MKLLHIKRAFGWASLLIYTLIKFWIKNPQATPAIVLFLIQKFLYLPKFLDRNIMVEKHTQRFSEEIKKITKIYDSLNKRFNLRSQDYFRNLQSEIPDRYALLYFIVRALKPKVIVETGVAAGVSTGYILQGLKDNGFGKLYSIDLPFQWYTYGNFKLHLDSIPVGKTPGYLIPQDLKKNWKLILGNTYEELPKLLKSLGKIDSFFHDSEHTYKTMTFEYQTAWPYIKNQGILISDDVAFNKAFETFTRKHKVKPIYFKELGIIRKP